jgi:SAM-dependent methyltransferase
MEFEKFKPVNDFDYSRGWDKFALDYINLPKNNNIYKLTKELIYKIIEKNIAINENSRVLDIGCGSGNDFPYFLSKKACITAFDMSTGMLNKACETYHNYIENGQLSLYRGRLEDFADDTFAGKKYDLIFSVSGGLSYITNDLMLSVFEILKTLLNPGGVIISGHFNSFCIAEFIYYLLRLDLKLIGLRAKDHSEIEIKNEKMVMYFRSFKKLKKMYSPSFKKIRFYPLLAFTPPYQTGYNPGKNLYNFHKKIEGLMLDYTLGKGSADQIIMVLENE